MEGGTKATLKKVGETLAFIVERMATRDDLAKLATKNDVSEIIRKEVPQIVREETKGISANSHRSDLEVVTEVDNIVGLPKEIDHALERIAAIEKHLGLNKKIAA